MPSEAEINHVKGLRESALDLNEQMVELQVQIGSTRNQESIKWKLEELKNNFEIQSSENMYLIPHFSMQLTIEYFEIENLNRTYFGSQFSINKIVHFEQTKSNCPLC